jgi:hypothetical protein
MTLQDIINFALSELGGAGAAQSLLESLVDDAGQKAADAVVKKVYLQQPSLYAGLPGAVGQDGHTNVQRLAQAGFQEYRHYLRDGNGIYPGAPDIDSGIGGAADVVYLDGECRKAIHDWTNASAANLLANPPAL